MKILKHCTVTGQIQDQETSKLCGNDNMAEKNIHAYERLQLERGMNVADCW